MATTLVETGRNYHLNSFIFILTFTFPIVLTTYFYKRATIKCQKITRCSNICNSLMSKKESL